jgi:hypothetical protein
MFSVSYKFGTMRLLLWNVSTLISKLNRSTEGRYKNRQEMADRDARAETSRNQGMEKTLL